MIALAPDMNRAITGRNNMRNPLSLLRNAQSVTQKTLEELQAKHQKLIVDVAKARHALDAAIAAEMMGQKVDVKAARLRCIQLKQDLGKVAEELDEKKNAL